MDYVVAAAPQIRVHVRDAGLACCAVEFGAAVGLGLLVPADGQAAQAHVLVVSGTVTQALVPEIVAAWDALPEPKAVVAFGACATSGGPYWDSYAVAPGIDAALPVQRYVPGCPPRPTALVAALCEAVA